jgi:hypothetical protein
VGEPHRGHPAGTEHALESVTTVAQRFPGNEPQCGPFEWSWPFP